MNSLRAVRVEQLQIILNAIRAYGGDILSPECRQLQEIIDNPNMVATQYSAFEGRYHYLVKDNKPKADFGI